MLHLPSTALYSRIYVWIPIGIYLFERCLRTLRYTYNNIHPGRATLIHLPGGATKIVVSTRQLKDWSPGSFVLLSLPRFGLGQSHPATIASIPSFHEGKLVFFLRARHGFTSRIHANASNVSMQESSASPEPPPDSKSTHLALIDGPYGGKQLDFASYSSVLLIAGSTGVSFTLPVLLDLSFRAQKQKLPTKHVTFVWAVKTSACTSWIESELKNASDELKKAGIEIVVRIFVTADEEFVESEDGGRSSAENCKNDKGKGNECSFISTSSKIPPTIEPNFLTERIETQDSIKEAVEEELKDKPLSHTDKNSVMTMQTGRPDLGSIVKEAQSKTQEGGEFGIAVCGPLGMTSETRRVVACLEWKSCGNYLHAESFGW
jgi:ferric-chelate reductase